MNQEMETSKDIISPQIAGPEMSTIDVTQDMGVTEETKIIMINPNPDTAQDQDPDTAQDHRIVKETSMLIANLTEITQGGELNHGMEDLQTEMNQDPTEQDQNMKAGIEIGNHRHMIQGHRDRLIMEQKTKRTSPSWMKTTRSSLINN